MLDSKKKEPEEGKIPWTRWLKKWVVMEWERKSSTSNNNQNFETKNHSISKCLKNNLLWTPCLKTRTCSSSETLQDYLYEKKIRKFRKGHFTAQKRMASLTVEIYFEQKISLFKIRSVYTSTWLWNAWGLRIELAYLIFSDLRKMLSLLRFFYSASNLLIFIGMGLHEKLEIAYEIVHTLLPNHASVSTTLNNIGLTHVSFWKQLLYLIYLILLCVISHVFKKKLFVRWQIYSWQIHACYRNSRNVSKISVEDNKTVSEQCTSPSWQYVLPVFIWTAHTHHLIQN